MARVKSFSESISTGRSPGRRGVSHGTQFIDFNLKAKEVQARIPGITSDRIRNTVSKAWKHDELDEVDTQILRVFGKVDYLPRAGYETSRLPKD
ncbi:MAG: hypothetical protein ABH950_10230 [Candidatus Altiarchaeota archaeon]